VTAGCLLALLVGGAFALLIVSVTDLRDTTRAVQESRSELLQVGRVERLVVDAETGQRGFLLTGEERFLQPWEHARRHFDAEAGDLVRMSTTREQQDRARQIQQAGSSYFRDFSVPVVDAARAGGDGARNEEVAHEGKQRLDGLRDHFNRYSATGSSLVATRQSADDAQAERAVAAAAVGLAGSVVLVITVSGYLLRAVVGPVRQTASATSRLAEGDLTVRVPSKGPRELAELADGFNTMAGSLQRSREREKAARRRLRLLYEAGAAVGSTLDATQTARHLVRVAVPRFADHAAIDHASADRSTPGTHRRLALAGVGDDGPFAPVGAEVPARATEVFVADLRTDTAWRERHPEEAEELLAHGVHSLITVPLTTHGELIGDISFWRAGDTLSFTEEDVADAQEIAAKTAVALDNADRYARERGTALTLQRSLLPHHPPSLSAVETATRYLPADTRAGAGGDWFDVIPLSGARVALVVGDVVGHGVHASAAMGRLRTAVRTLADVDLAPDELLTHLDDLVIHLTEDDSDESRQGTELGATCLYAVYDPTTCRCVLASAGHPLPVTVTPEGHAGRVSGHTGPPLGVGGLPFEATELSLTPGSLFALFTNGLLQRDVGLGMDRLCELLSRPEPSLDSLGDAVVGTLMAGAAADDAALLLTRTRALAPSDIATWDIPADPSEVTRARTVVSEQLAAWQLTETSFVTELAVSELVTNAIRYGRPPIRLRLIRDASLICEVSDANNTAPHMRRARVFDEGGRGLLLVAQLSSRWGTRHHPGGKTIWCEQTLPGHEGT
jgi:serine phosphatase RsbU (regulator of sigma subunit)/CHASE3 domain sensor protein/anti-sigma regulatory factor (Ser/Thr protein kinase)